MDSQPNLINLPGGGRILCDFMPERESAAIGVWVKTGSRNEPARWNGISHFLEHMLFKGTRRRTSREISQAIEGRGGTLNGFTGEECTCYWAKVRADHLDATLEVLLDLFLHPRLSPPDVEKERGVIKEEIRMNRDNPASHVHHLLQETMWPRQPLGRPIVGTETTVDGIRRSDLAGYKKSRYVLSGTVVVACGNIRPEAVVATVKRRISRAPSGPGATPRRALYNRAPGALALEKRPIEQSNLCVGLEGLPRLHPQSHALHLLNIILGANMSSRLFQEIREKRGWAYYIRSGLEFYRDTGALIIDAGVPPERVEICLQLIIRQLLGLVRSLPSADEFERAREYYLGQTALFLEHTVNRMFWLGEHMVCEGRVLTPGEIFRKISLVTPEEIRQTARRLFRPSRLCCALVGPGGDRDRISRNLQW